MRSKHNKKRNTAFIYEALIRELTSNVIGNDQGRKKSVVKIVKEHFKKGTLLNKELELYRTLLETVKLTEEDAELILNETKRQYSLIDQQSLREEKGALIYAINKTLSKSVFQNFVPNYKSIATVYQIFNGSGSPSKRVMLEKKMIEDLTCVPQQKEEQQPISKLAFKTFVEKFNTTYGEALLNEQKELLSRFVASFDDNGLELKIYLNEEIGRLKQELNSCLEIDELKEDVSMREKTQSVIELLESFAQKEANQELIEQVLKIQQLVGEMKDNVN